MPERHYIPEPTIFLVGCQPWPPLNWSSDPDHCPVCGSGIRADDHRTYCGWSDETSPAREAQIARERRSEEIGLVAKDRSKAADQRARERLRRKVKVVLNESERRQIWNGYLGIREERSEITNLAKIGREFLRSIGQEPRWHLDFKDGQWVDRTTGQRVD